MIHIFFIRRFFILSYIERQWWYSSLVSYYLIYYVSIKLCCKQIYVCVCVHNKIPVTVLNDPLRRTYVSLYDFINAIYKFSDSRSNNQKRKKIRIVKLYSSVKSYGKGHRLSNWEYGHLCLWECICIQNEGIVMIRIWIKRKKSDICITYVRISMSFFYTIEEENRRVAKVTVAIRVHRNLKKYFPFNRVIRFKPS